MKLVFTCGGTAGHINPAIAVAGRIKHLLPSSEIMFIGAENMMEMELVPLEGYEIKSVKITNISRKLSFNGIIHNFNTVKNVIFSTRKAKTILQDFAPDAVIGTGGYVCYPVITAAHELEIPTFIHESNAGPGLTTRMLSPKVDKILVGFNCKNEYKNSDKVIVTGTPVRNAFSLYTKESARSELGISKNEKIVLSVWGSLGAGYMNNIISNMISIIDQPSFRLIHATGKNYYSDFVEKINLSCPNYKEKKVIIKKYIQDMARLMAAADIIICRAGASTLSELTFLGKPAILIPSPNVVENHQEKNARLVEKTGGAILLTESKVTPEVLLEKINALLSNEEKLEFMAECMRKESTNNAADKIADTIINYVQQR